MKPISTTKVFAAVIGWCSFLTFADLLVWEDFDYDISVDASLAGKGSATNGWSGAWSATSGTIVDVSATPLSAAGVTGGNQALRSSNLNANTFANRSIDPSVNTAIDDKDLWISYLLRYESGGTGIGRAHLYNTQSNWDHRFFGADDDAAGDFRLSRSYNNIDQGGPQFNVGDTVLLVLKLTSNGTQWTHHDVWINPTSAGATGAGDLSLASTSGWSSLPGLGFTHRSNSQTLLWDRLRVGESFADVAAIPEPGVTGLLLLGAALFRRRVRGR